MSESDKALYEDDEAWLSSHNLHRRDHDSLQGSFIAHFLSFTCITKNHSVSQPQAIKGCNKCKKISRERSRRSGRKKLEGCLICSQNDQFVERRVETVMLQSREYRSAANKTEAKRIAMANGVQLSSELSCELHRLPYFNLINMCIESPIHTLLLVLVKKEMEMLLEQDTSAPNYNLAVPLNQRMEFQRRLKSIQVPSDCGRLPLGLEEKKGL